MLAELKMVCQERLMLTHHHFETVKPVELLVALHQQFETLTAVTQLDHLSDAVKTKYSGVFDAIPHLDKLPTDIYCWINLKDPLKTIATHSYSTPQKYKEAWAMLIQQHLDAGQIRPSNSEHASPTFIVPKCDPMVLLHSVNDYCALNSNRVTDSHPLPLVDDILAPKAKSGVQLT